jgi:capsular exopolysaccharide synthesis family protein
MKVVDRLNEHWLMATEIHKLETRLWRKSQRDGFKVVLFTSASRGEGKSTTVACLATSLGLYPGRRVLAVDLDFRVPQLNSHFEVSVSHGLGEVLRGECAIEEAIIKTGLPSLDIALPCSEGEDPALLLNTTALWEMFVHFRKNYDLILMDVPALIPVADTSMLLPLSDGVVLLAMAGKTTKHELSKAREMCLGMEANILGLVVGNLQEATPEYGYGYGYGYHREDGNSKREMGEGRTNPDVEDEHG